MEDWHPIIAIALLILVALIIPPIHDPAIRLKERNERKRMDQEKRDAE